MFLLNEFRIWLSVALVFQFVVFFFVLILYSKEVLHDNAKHDNSIATIKFVGHQYNYLTGIMDQLNVCFSIQVWKINSSVCCDIDFIYIFIGICFKVGYDLYGHIICFLCTNKFFILSIYYSTKWILQGIIIDSFRTHNIF